MKKIIAFTLLLIICVTSLGVLAARGVTIYDVAPSYGNTTLMNDSANLLKGSTIEKLETRLTKLGNKYNMDIVILTVKNTGDLSNQEFADDYYDYCDYRTDGVLLLINTDPNGWHISTSGKGKRYLTDYGLDKIGALIKPDLKKGNFAEAFDKYIDLMDTFLKEAKENKPYDTNHKYKTTGDIIKMILIMLLIALLVAGGVIWWMIRSMNTVRKQAGATAYSKGLNLTGSSDIYLYSHTVSHRIQTESSGGGSSSHTGSSGRSHGGRGGSF